MGFCIIQTDAVKEWLKLARCVSTPTKSGKPNMVWEILPFRIPHEYEDIRFIRACRYLDQGYAFYIESSIGKKWQTAKIPVKVLEKIAEENAKEPVADSIFTDVDKQSLRAFFAKDDREPPKPEPKPLTEKQKKAQTLKALAEKGTFTFKKNATH